MLCTAQDKDAVRLTLEQIDVIRRMCTENPAMELVTTAEGTIAPQPPPDQDISLCCD